MRRLLRRVGASTRRHATFALLLASLAYGVVRESFGFFRWRRTVRAEFRRVLRQAVGEGFSTTLIAAALVGLGMVSQALFWLTAIGGQGLIRSVLITVLVREITPLLVGIILLGRTGTVALYEIGTLARSGQIRALEAQGLDPFDLIVLPRACAIAIASFTLGMTFVLTALVTGFVAGSLIQVVQTSIWTFLDRVLLAMNVSDFIVFPMKMIAIGLLVALTACLTGLGAGPRDDLARLLPTGFMRGVVAILLASVALSLV